MSRRTRPNLPGSTFHLTTRVHRSEALFAPELRTALVGIIRDQLVFSDMDLFAYAIMPNHFHLVVRQRQMPLSRFMQPIVRRAALLLQRFHGREGHVFERRYRDRSCADPQHLRNAIVYTHMNPVRAGLCANPEEYAWTSHAAWLGKRIACDGRPDPVAAQHALPIFATAADRTRPDFKADYLAFLAWRVELDRFRVSVESGVASGSSSEPPALSHGDSNWLLYMTPCPPSPVAQMVGPKLTSSGSSGRVDLSEIARLALLDAGPGLDPARVRSRWGGPAYIRARHAIIRRAAASGYTGVQIAAYLRITPAAVSRVFASDREQLLKQSA